VGVKGETGGTLGGDHRERKKRDQIVAMVKRGETKKRQGRRQERGMKNLRQQAGKPRRTRRISPGDE